MVNTVLQTQFALKELDAEGNEEARYGEAGHWGYRGVVEAAESVLIIQLWTETNAAGLIMLRAWTAGASSELFYHGPVRRESAKVDDWEGDSSFRRWRQGSKT